MRRIVSVIAAATLTLSFIGCQSNGKSNSGSRKAKESTDVTLNIGISAYNLGTNNFSENQAKNRTLADVILTGQLTALNLDTNGSESFSWYATLDEGTLEMVSEKTVALDAGDYRFSMILYKGGQQYAGEAVDTIDDEGQQTVSLMIKPVIGDTIVNAMEIDEIGDFKFQYSTQELAGFTDPSIGISIDGGSESQFALSKTTGSSQGYINLTDGNHSIRLHLYDGGFLKGRSVTSQEEVNITRGNPVTLNLLALHGEAVFAFDVAEDNASFTVNIPSEIVQEVGGLGNLGSILRLTQDGNLSAETPGPRPLP